MIYLSISILISSSLFVVFKMFNRYKVDLLQAIVVNYLVASLIGYSSSSIPLSLTEIPSQPWFIGAFFLGILFIAVFNIMGLTAQENGLSVASVASKMSVIVPVVFGVFAYNEGISFLKIIGILLALLAVYLVSAKSDTKPVQLKSLSYPILLFLGSGFIDTSIKYIETTAVPNGGVPVFSATIFGFAFLFGILFLVVQSIRGVLRLALKNVIGGIVLGVPNYFSIVYLLKALKSDGLESSILFTINNVGIVVLSTIFGLLLFKEHLIIKNWLGIALAIVSILLVVSV